MANSEKLWGFTCLEIATDGFWKRFAESKRELRSFAVAQTSKFPERFVVDFLDRLDRMEWSESDDPEYAKARKVMERLVVKKSDPAEFVSSMIELDKKTKRIEDRARSKEKKSQTATIPEPTMDQIEQYVSKFWDDFFIAKPDFRSFAEERRADFPESFMSGFIEKLDGYRWDVSKDSEYKVAVAVMKVLASTTRLEEEEALIDTFVAEREAEEKAKEEEDERVKKAEEERKQSEKEERNRKEEAEREKEKKKKEKDAASKKLAKETKARAKLQNQIKRVGGKSIGL